MDLQRQQELVDELVALKKQQMAAEGRYQAAQREVGDADTARAEAAQAVADKTAEFFAEIDKGLAK